MDRLIHRPVLPFLKVNMFVNRVIFYEVMLAIMVLTVLAAMWIERSKFGIGLRRSFKMRIVRRPKVSTQQS